MMKFNDLLKKLRNDFDLQKRSCEDELGEVLKEVGAKKIAENLNVDKHRWYETSTQVYSISVDEGERYLGIHCVSDFFSESSCWEDFYHVYNFFKMKKVLIASYSRIEE